MGNQAGDYPSSSLQYHTALDVSLRFVYICIINDEAVIQFESKAASDVDEIVHCIKSF